MRNSKSYIVGFLADLVLKFSNEIDIFNESPYIALFVVSGFTEKLLKALLN